MYWREKFKMSTTKLFLIPGRINAALRLLFVKNTPSH